MNSAGVMPLAAPSTSNAALSLPAVLATALVLAVVAATPPLLAIAGGGALLLASLVAFRPFLGALAVTIFFPLMSTLLILRVGASHDMPSLLLYPADLLAGPVLAGLALNRLLCRRRVAPPESATAARERRWIVWFASAFLVWGVTRVGASLSLPHAVLAYGRALNAAVFVAFLTLAVDTERRLMTLLRVFCGTSLALSIMAVVATNHAFDSVRLLFLADKAQVWGEFLLYNTPIGFNPSIVGMVPGYGLTQKHTLGLYLSAALVFSFLFFLRTRSRVSRLAWGALGLVLATVSQQAFSRLSLSGLLLATAGVMLLVRPWRLRIPGALLGILALYAVGYAASRPFYPAHMSNRETITSAVGRVGAASEWNPSSLAERGRYWRTALQRISRHPLTGGGPDSLNVDLTALVPHPHNFILALWADYGLVGLCLAGGALAAIGARAYRVLWRAPRPDDPCWQVGAAVTVGVLCALFEYSFDMPVFAPPLWFMTGLLLATLRLVERKG